MSEKLQLKLDLTLKKAISIARQSELIKAQNAGTRAIIEDSGITWKFKQLKQCDKGHVKARDKEKNRRSSEASLWKGLFQM